MRLQRRVIRIAGCVLAALLLAVVVLTVFQRKLLFPAPPPRELSSRAGEVVLGRTQSGRRVAALWSPAPGGSERALTVVYLHGNGMQLADSAELAPLFHQQSWNVYSIEYPGYGPLAGDSPSEEAIIDVASSAMSLLRARYSVTVERTVLVGQSLGTGVAAALAARAMGSRLVLISPFRSITKVAAGLFPWAPVRWLVRDKFDTDSLAPSIRIPVLIVHGTLDEVIPFAHGEHLAGRFSRATFVRIEGGHHNDLFSDHLHETIAALSEFLTNHR